MLAAGLAHVDCMCDVASQVSKIALPLLGSYLEALNISELVDAALASSRGSLDATSPRGDVGLSQSSWRYAVAVASGVHVYRAGAFIVGKPNCFFFGLGSALK